VKFHELVDQDFMQAWCLPVAEPTWSKCQKFCREMLVSYFWQHRTKCQKANVNQNSNISHDLLALTHTINQDDNLLGKVDVPLYEVW